MARKKTPPEYGESDYISRSVSISPRCQSDHVQSRALQIHSLKVDLGICNFARER
jgi:hypothetical protein